LIIYFIRHTRTALSSGICYGQHDAPLAESFIEEAAETKAKLDVDVEKVFSSPLQRCVKLADELFGNKTIIDERIKELDFGQWELMRWDEIDRESFLNWSSNYFVTKAGITGESCEQLYKRAEVFYNELLQSGVQSAALVTHAGVIRCFFSMILNIRMEDAFKLDLSYGSVSKVRIEGEYIKFDYINK
jgi:alpha-ribazole phosphatase